MILVTGGTGLLGAHLLYRLVNDNEEVIAIYRDDKSLTITKEIFGYYSNPSCFDQIIWKQGDILDTQFLDEIMKGIQFVYHAAAIVSFDPKDRDLLMNVNINGTSNVVNAALANQVEKMCYVSSIGSFGRANRDNMVNEQTEWENDLKPSGYSISKHHGEMEVWRGIEEGLNAVIVNPSTILGSGNWHRGSSALFNKIANALPYYTEGMNGYVDVNDVVEVMIQLMNSPINSERFIIVGENLNYRNFLSMMAKALNKKPPHIKVTKGIASFAIIVEKITSFLTGKSPLITRETANVAMDSQQYSNEKIVAELNFKFTPIENSINRVANDFMKNVNP